MQSEPFDDAATPAPAEKKEEEDDKGDEHMGMPRLPSFACLRTFATAMSSHGASAQVSSVVR